MDINSRFNEEKHINSIKLDKKDLSILTTLSKDARTPLSKIAKSVNLSRDSINYRIKRMERKGLLLQFTPIINLRAFGFNSYNIYLLLKEGKTEKRNNLIKSLKENPNVKEILEYTDRWDLELVFIAKDIREMDVLKEEMLNPFSDIIIEKSTLQNIRVYSSNYFPISHFEENFSPTRIRGIKEFKYDQKDIEILKELSKDCRTSTYKIGEKVNLSADAVGKRIKKLVKEEIIERFTIIVNLSMLGFHWYTFAMRISAMGKKEEKKLAFYSQNSRNILRAAKYLGSWDIIFYILSDSNKGLHKTIKDIKSEFSEIIKTHQTWVAYKEHYFSNFPEIIWKETKK